MAEANRLEYSPSQLESLTRRLTAAHPAMAAVWAAAHSDDPRAFIAAARRSQRTLVLETRRLLKRRARVVTLSYSSTVLAALARKDLRVTVAESLPGGEGRDVRRQRRKSGLQTTVVPDAALALAVSEADCVVLGADAVTPTLVVNKVGTHLLALAARDAGVPCYVLADTTKFVPAAWPIPVYSDRRPFEATPRRLFTRILSGNQSA